MDTRDTGTDAASAWQPNPFLDTLYDYVPFLDAGPIAAPPPGAEPRIAIVGAGAAGLVAGYELLRAGFRPKIFEAAEAVGGRCRTLDMGGGALAEMGAMRVPLSHRTFWHYMDEIARLRGRPVDHEAFPDPGKVDTLLYYRNRRLPWPAGHPPPPPFDGIQKDFTAFFGKWVAPFAAVWGDGRSAPPEKLRRLQTLWQAAITENLGQTFAEGVQRGTGWDTAHMEAFGALGLGSGGFGPMFPINFISALRFLLEGDETDQQFIREGLQPVLSTLLEARSPDGTTTLGACVTCDCPVTAIDQHAGRPVLRFADRPDATFDAAVMALSTRAADTLGLTLPAPSSGACLLPEDAAAAIRGLHMTASSKLFIRTATKFWTDTPDLPQMILTDELPRATYCLDYPGTDHGVVLISYVWEDDSATVAALEPEEMYRRCLRALSAAHPGFAARAVPMDGQFHKIDWVNAPGFHGGFQLPHPGQEPLIKAAYYQFQTAKDPARDTGVYLAGDGISYQGGWIEGAMRTGVNAACAAALRAGGTVRAGSPLEQDSALYDYEHR